ncbi:MAG: dephospho-CoA kinase, partial [Methylophilaceae bacterium]|nr:dephospho-CoA kinase [Methylophilaceae bacterium]
MWVVGMTGGIGCGKSEVARLFSALGVPIVDVDKISHDLTKAGQPILQKILDTSAKLRAINTRVGQPLRENEWLMSIKQRAIIPGGLCE